MNGVLNPCVAATCMQDGCCDEVGTWAALKSGGGTLIRDAPPRCDAVICTDVECCDDRGICGGDLPDRVRDQGDAAELRRRQRVHP